jgi:dihydropteroate synthase
MPGMYLEPLGLLYGAAAKQAIALKAALPLTGGPIAFSAARLWEGEPGTVEKRIVSLGAIEASSEPRLRDLLERIVSLRAPVAGITMDGPRIMGVVNVTPDSFSDGGDLLEADAAIAHARKLADDGADLIDVGAESTRPGSSPVPVEEELRRLRPVLNGLAGFSLPVSVDTRKPEVMLAAAAAGAAILNDVSALTFAPDSLPTAAALKKPVVLTHAQGSPETMQENPVYRDAVIEVYDFLEARIEAAVAAGLPRDCIIADPGIGFGKTLAHNRALLQSIALFHGLGVPLLTGTSRKGLIREITRVEDPKQRIAGSIASALDAIQQGVQIVRVHDVAAMHQALSVWKFLRGSPNIATE